MVLTPRDDVLGEVRNYFERERRSGINRRTEAWRSLSENFIRTADGSYTLESDSPGEAMHTRSGAITESFEKFVRPSIPHDAEEIRVLDLCSGLGYNTAALLEFTSAIEVTVDMVEVSPETLSAALIVPSPVPSHELVKAAYEDRLMDMGIVGIRAYPPPPPQVTLRVHCEDARETLQKLEADCYDAIFLDAFSPGVSPELYTVEFLSQIARVIKPDGVLATYTSAAPLRSALIEAGFHVGAGPVFGRKSAGTLASKDPSKLKEPLEWMDERMVALSDAGIPYRDPLLSSDGETIIERRRAERRLARGVTRISSAVKTPIYLGVSVEGDRIGRRVRRNLERMGISDPAGEEALYIICPQMDECVCGCGEERLATSRERILSMRRRLLEVVSFRGMIKENPV
ncbi:tRNA (5-methylaminomethyl-2-thiouridine)(34)-methyltransferase MnmD [Methanothermobacter sp. K4]|uniref:tRNA (5-methylaminomethyl-2-thiouridine)(34)-methyltransferase MnmD n=1 Tax=Methanothermobacter sp. K4 TaxID=2913262 RepID=UPI001EDAA770|nr:MnmC family methyltransferase [Methanothermobacter sp. K4]MCG2829087.1 hypothetical protein [Methanothermobacter sp. K4]